MHAKKTREMKVLLWYGFYEDPDEGGKTTQVEYLVADLSKAEIARKFDTTVARLGEMYKLSPSARHFPKAVSEPKTIFWKRLSNHGDDAWQPIQIARVRQH